MGKSIEIISSVKFDWRDAYESLRAKEQKPFKNEVLAKCNWGSETEFILKKKGDRKMTNEHWDLIKTLFLQHGIDAENGTLIQNNNHGNKASA